LFFRLPLEYSTDWALPYLHLGHDMDGTEWSVQFNSFHRHWFTMHETSNQESSEKNCSLSRIFSQWNANWGRSSLFEKVAWFC
jgi:hypothetical protein